MNIELKENIKHFVEYIYDCYSEKKSICIECDTICIERDTNNLTEIKDEFIL
jgi:hypothetical protein